MQINKVNHAKLTKELGITDFLDAKQGIKAGTYMLANLLNTYGTTHKALMAYSGGDGGAQSYWARNIYTSRYSREVSAKQELIKQNKYNI